MRGARLAWSLVTAGAVLGLLALLAIPCTAAEEGGDAGGAPAVVAPSPPGSEAPAPEAPERPRDRLRAGAQKKDNGGWAAVAGGLVALGGILGLGLLMAAASPLFVARASVATSAFKLHTALWGIAASFLLLLLAAVFGGTGHPGAAGFFWLSWFALGAIGFSGFARNAGERLLARDGTGQPPRPVLSTFTGLIVCGWVFLVPVLGWLLSFVALVVGTGASMQAIFKARKLDEAAPALGPVGPVAGPRRPTFTAPPTIVSDRLSATPGAIPTTPPPAPPTPRATAPPPPPQPHSTVLDVNLGAEEGPQGPQEGQPQ